MNFYHGTCQLGLTELKPSLNEGSTINEPLVYLSSDTSLAVFYIWDKPYYFHTYGFDTGGRIVYEEYFENQLKYFYQGKKGAIYTCEGDFENKSETGIKTLFTSKNSVKIQSQEIIEDAYQHILKLEKEQKIKIIRFKDLTEKSKEKNIKQIESLRKSSATSKELLKLIEEKM
ncbi:MAG: hypothetical protein FWE22_03365 [Firmicutes bacterium]|nr:hypothetical protein [Bacillota bacterium]